MRAKPNHYSPLHFHSNQPKMLFPLLLLVVPFFLLLPSESSIQCQNQIHVKDLLQNEGFLHFRNVHLLTFDEGGRQACDHRGKAAIHLPGWIKLHSGEVIVQKPLALTNSSKLILALTLEQDSLWVGRICEGGKSQSAFLSDQFCSLDFCKILPAACKFLSLAKPNQLFPLSAFFPPQGIHLDQIFHTMLEGQWQAEAELIKEEEESDQSSTKNIIALAKVGIEGWHSLNAKEHEEL